MLFSIRIPALVALLLLATALPAAAQTITTQLSDQPDSAITLLSLPGATNGSSGLVSNSTYLFGTNNSNSITFSGNSGIYSGTTSGVAAAPSTPTGADTASYLAAGSTGSGTTITYGTAQNQFDLLWGSVDAGNTLKFYGANGTLVGTVTGSQVQANANGAQNSSGSYYVDINNFSSAFTTVVATTPTPAFEFTPAVQASPAPAPTLGTNPLSALILVAGAALMAWSYRRKLQG